MYQLAMEMVSQEFRISLMYCAKEINVVFGRICMDQLFIDDEVIILGESFDIDTLSENCNTISNETFTAFKRRITKKAVN